ncbi:MAG: SDR family oxidoreductase [Candidatus Marsarchaeota archaeon]|nr:SDR family oxidoreductase [Candidatus Marsarchaeota archaeon]MCL5106011.1 SDR family oxidoreductase [Candidatus Marsarchaeota archaeon]
MKKINTLLDLSGKTAVVTGGAKGIGYGIAYRLGEAGANVVIANRNRKEGTDAANELKKLGFEAFAVKTDVSAEDDVKNLIASTMKKYSGLDILVNNAGIYPIIPLEQMSLKDFQEVISINLNGVFLCTKYAAQEMVKKGRGGKIINITSVDALHPSSVGLAHYDASKHGVWGFTKNIALELAPHGIWVNAIAPGGILTPGLKKLQDAMPKNRDSKKMIEDITRKLPMRRLGDPDEIGKVALFLASDMSSYMTGTQIVVDGGMLLFM